MTESSLNAWKKPLSEAVIEVPITFQEWMLIASPHKTAGGFKVAMLGLIRNKLHAAGIPLGDKARGRFAIIQGRIGDPAVAFTICWQDRADAPVGGDWGDLLGQAVHNYEMAGDGQ